MAVHHRHHTPILIRIPHKEKKSLNLNGGFDVPGWCLLLLFESGLITADPHQHHPPAPAPSTQQPPHALTGTQDCGHKFVRADFIPLISIK